MGKTHFDAVSGINGVYVGAKGLEVQIASTTGALYQAGVAVTSSAAELNILDGVTATTAELNAYAVTAYMADANTAGSCYVVCPHAGNIVGVSVVNYVTNTTAATVYTAKIGGVSVTHPALQHGATDAAGTGVSVMATANNAVTAGQVVELASDGGGTPVMPIMVTLLISR